MVGPAPPSADDGVTPDMCIPIFPNATHPRDRSALHTEPEFPYSNCYHLSNIPQQTVRIRPRAEEFEDDNAYKLPMGTRIALWDMLDEDAERMLANRARYAQSTSPPLVDTQEVTPLTEKPATGARSTASLEERSLHGGRANSELMTENAVQTQAATEVSNEKCSMDGESLPMEDDHDCRSISSAGSFDVPSANASFIRRVDNEPPAPPAPPRETWPLVDLWFELTEHLAEHEIPNPQDFLKESAALAALVRTALQRSEEENACRRLGTRNSGSVYTNKSTYTYDGAQSQANCLSPILSPLGKLRVIRRWP
ncbi:hypothetical protein C8Q76DRAFT_206030 [Earliella scabrosa]|nr:hypothetical protein C8Q76DRAFT_206030 [Earliella scabrosa]